MKNRKHLHIWISTLCLLTFAGAFIAAAIQKVPVVIEYSKNNKHLRSRTDTRKIEKIVRGYFKLDVSDSPYESALVKVSRTSDANLRDLMVYLFYRNIYLIDLVELTIDNNYAIIKVDGTPLNKRGN